MGQDGPTPQVPRKTLLTRFKGVDLHRMGAMGIV